jgi:hypothetical protein
MIMIALAYGLMSLTLYSAAWKDTQLDSLARIMACGTAMSLSLVAVL